MRSRIDLSKYDLTVLRLRQNVEYILTVPHGGIVVSTSPNQNDYYERCLGNGTNEVYLLVTRDMLEGTDSVWVRTADRSIPVSFVYEENVLAEHLDDIVPAFIEDEYPLFKKLMEYYFGFLGLELKPSHFIHTLEKYADVDETIDEFRLSILSEVVPYLRETAADSRLLSKHILSFYTRRGTEDSIRFLLRVLFNREIDIIRQRDRLLISSHKVNGVISDKNNVLAGNYLFQLYSYIIYVDDQRYNQYRERSKQSSN